MGLFLPEVRSRNTILRSVAIGFFALFAASVLAPSSASADATIEVEAHKGRSLDAAKQFIMDIAQQSMILLQAPDKSSRQRQADFREL